MPQMILLPLLHCVLISLVYIYFKMNLGDECTESPFTTYLKKFVLVNVFSGCTPLDIKAEIVRQYNDVNAALCIIFFAMSSFGMGVDCFVVHQVFFSRRCN